MAALIRFFEFLFGCDADVAQHGSRQLGEEALDGIEPGAVLALSEQRQGVCVGRSTRRPKWRLGREGAPLGQRGGAPLFVNLAGDEIALLIEMVVDLGMN